VRGASITRPLALTISGTGMTGLQRLLTPEPKEVAVAAGGAVALTIDLGAVQLVDTVFIGFTSAPPTITLQLSYGVAGGFTSAFEPATAPLDTRLFTPRRHFAVDLAASVSARYIGVAGTLPAGTEIGVVAVGRRFCPAFGHEAGAGRPLSSTATTARRPDGGIGSDGGVTYGGFAWTYGDLTDSERDDLWAIVRDRGFDLPVLVVEEAGTPFSAQAERYHWGTFTRIDTYERKVPDTKTVWSLRVDDWE